MRKNGIRTVFSTGLCIVLIVAMALFTAGCGQNNNNRDETHTLHTEVFEDGAVIGDGGKQFTLTVDDGSSEKTFAVYTDRENVGAALIENKVIYGSEGPYGLYITEVNGTVADYDTTKTYWAFYTDGNYAVTGIELTAIEENTVYMLKVEKS